jgi:PH/SEC7 domain-containing protein
MVMVEKPVIPPEKNRLSEGSSKVSGHIKKRSLSVGDMQLRNALTATSSNTPPPASKDAQRREETPGWDSRFNGIMSDFKGELSQLDPTSSSALDLRDPSTPSRQRSFPGSKTNHLFFSHNEINQDGRQRPSIYTPSPAPTLTLDLASDVEELDVTSDTESRTPRTSTTEATSAPPRTPALASSSTSNGSTRMALSRRGSSQLNSRHSNPFTNLSSRGIHGHSSSRDLGRLRVQHRSAASSSEPSLIPTGDGASVREQSLSIRLVPSSQRVISWNTVSPTRNLGFQQDLSISDLSQANGEDGSSDMAVRGKELASRCWAEDEQFLAKEKIAEWLGGQCVFPISSVIDLFKPFKGVASIKSRCTTTWTFLTFPD